MAHDWSGNRAQDGFFVDLLNNQVLSRQTTLGFNRSQFDHEVPTDVFIASGLSTDAIEAALKRAAQNGGGIVRLPAGSGVLDAQIKDAIPSNILIEGAGQAKTKLTFAGKGHAFWIFDRKNVVIRDLTLDCNQNPTYGINFEYVTNVMVERCTVEAAKNGNVRFRFTDGMTIRYCTLSNCRDFHGIAIKDIFEAGSFRSEEFAQRQFESQAHTFGSIFTRNQAIYSNHCFRNGGNGINDHGIEAELCGNLSENNGFGGKSYDGRHQLFHHNTFRDNRGRGYAINATLGYPGRMPGFLTFRDNRFAGNGGNDLGFYTSGSYGDFFYEGPVLLADNAFSPTSGKTNIVNQPGRPTMRVCPQSSDLNASWSSRDFNLASENECKSGPVIPITTGFTAAPLSGSAPLLVRFSDTSSPAERIVSWLWTIDGQEFSRESNPQRTFERSGDYVIELTVASADGSTASSLQTITVSLESAHVTVLPLLKLGVQMGLLTRST